MHVFVTLQVGMLVLSQGRSLADTYHMLRVELLLWHTNHACSLFCRHVVTGEMTCLSDYPPSTEVSRHQCLLLCVLS